jgi:hypothetical protein
VTATAYSRDVLLFDYGLSPRAPSEESLGGDMSRSVVLASILREKLLEARVEVGNAEQEQEYGAVIWLPEGCSIAVEAVPEWLMTWAVRFAHRPGCLALLGGRQPEDEIIARVKEALVSAIGQSEDFRNIRGIGLREYRTIRG